MSLLKQVVAVACKDNNGMADMFVTSVEVTQDQYDDGDHYDLAIKAAEDARYEPPFLCYDQTEHSAIVDAAKSLRVEESSDVGIVELHTGAALDTRHSYSPELLDADEFGEYRVKVGYNPEDNQVFVSLTNPLADQLSDVSESGLHIALSVYAGKPVCHVGTCGEEYDLALNLTEHDRIDVSRMSQQVAHSQFTSLETGHAEQIQSFQVPPAQDLMTERALICNYLFENADLGDEEVIDDSRWEVDGDTSVFTYFVDRGDEPSAKHKYSVRFVPDLTTPLSVNGSPFRSV